jgi:hypothetical protein
MLQNISDLIEGESVMHWWVKNIIAIDVVTS